MSYTQYLNLYFVIQKDAHDSPRGNAPETPTEESPGSCSCHAQEHHDITCMAIAAVGIPVGHEFTLSE